MNNGFGTSFVTDAKKAVFPPGGFWVRVPGSASGAAARDRDVSWHCVLRQNPSASRSSLRNSCRCESWVPSATSSG